MGSRVTLAAPEPLTAHHDTNAFTCGVESLDRWLKQRALKNQITGVSRTFVVCEDKRVLAYYALALQCCRCRAGHRRLRVMAAADVIGIRGLLVHALSPEVQAFYEHVGFESSPLQPMTLMATLSDARAADRVRSQA